MTYLEQTAVINPDALLRDPRFWRRCRPLWAALLGGIAFMLFLNPLTRPQAQDPTAWLTVFIQLLVFGGVTLAVRALARIEVDDAIARVVEQRSTRELARIKGGWRERISLSRLGDLLPQNPSHDKGLLRLFQHILEEAKDRKFHANAVVIEPFRDEGVGDLLRIQTVQKLALQLGILGTFAGLIIALRELTRQGKDLLDPDALNELFAALHISFSTSIAGLETAMILAVVLLVVRRRQEDLFKNMESSSAAMIALARNSINEDDFLVELDQVRTALTGVGERIRDQAREVEVQTAVIRDGLRRLAEIKGDFDSFLGRIREEQGVVLKEMKSVYEIISPKNVAEDLRQSLNEANRQVAESFRNDLRLSLAELGVATDGLKLIRKIEEQTRREWQKQSEMTEASHQAFRQATTELMDVVRKSTLLQADLLGKLEARHDGPAPESIIPRSLPAALPPTTEKIEKGLDKVARQLEILVRELDRNNSMLFNLVSVHSFYRSLIHKPREWWDSFLRFFSRLRMRPGGVP